LNIPCYQVADRQGHRYKPSWYPKDRDISLSDMLSDMTATLPSTLSHCSHDPSSRTGSGGDGSSGGGGW